MIVAFVLIVALLIAALVVQTLVFARQLRDLRDERENYVRLVVARHAGEALALVPPRGEQRRDEEENPYRHHPPLPEGI